MSFADLNVPQNHVYLFKPQPLMTGPCPGAWIWYNLAYGKAREKMEGFQEEAAAAL